MKPEKEPQISTMTQIFWGGMDEAKRTTIDLGRILRSRHQRRHDRLDIRIERPEWPRGWPAEINCVRSNAWFAVLSRNINTAWGMVTHMAVRNAAGTDIPWADKQWLKNELCGPEAVAVDAANMYHLWVLHEMVVPFGIGDEEKQGLREEGTTGEESPSLSPSMP